MNEERVSRISKLPEIGAAGIRVLSGKTVLVVGLGGLGCASAPLLARSGVGRLLLADPKPVDEPDLGRQQLFSPVDLGRNKATVASERLSPFCEALPVPAAIETSNLTSIARNVDLTVDGTDQLAPREVMNSWAVETGRTVIFGGAVGWHGMVFPVLRGGPCWHCAFAESDAAPTCDEAGVWSPLVAIVGALQASLALKVLLGIPVRPTLLTLNLVKGTNRELRISRKSTCPACSQKNF